MSDVLTQVLPIFGQLLTPNLGGIDNSVYAWDLRKPEKEVMRLAGHENTITGLSVNKAGTHLVTNGVSVRTLCRVGKKGFELSS